MGGSRVIRSRVLVVDDESRNRALVRAILQTEHEIVDAIDAIDAYRALEHGGIDLVLLDVMMPGIDGFAACRAIKDRFGEPYLPVLLLTALHEQTHRNEGLEAGADDFLTKPIDHRELQLRVRAFLRLRHQDELIRQQLAELQRLDRLKDDLAALIVHDLRNPLAGLDGFLRLMQRDAGDGERELFGSALLAARNLRETIEDMLKVRLMEEAQLELARRRISARQLAEAAVASLRGDADERRLALAVAGAPSHDDAVDADETLLRRAIENLVANALRYTRSGTGVDVWTARDGAIVTIDVADRGPGIADAYKPVLFQKYGSVEANAGDARRGNGLGLYFVRLTAEAHGGTVAALDRPGGGTIFRIQLPAA